MSDEEATRYGPATRFAAASLLVIGWISIPLSSRFEAWAATSISSILLVVAFALLLVVACVVVLVRSIPRSLRERSLECCIVSAGVSVLAVVLAIAPLLDLVGPAILPGVVLPAAGWDGLLAFGVLSWFAALITAPSQFLWRTVSPAKRWLALGVFVAVPWCLAVTPDPQPSVRHLALTATALALMACVVGCAELARRVYDPDPLFSRDPVPTTAYAPRESEHRVAVALSGGGYRASLFTLGAMLYVHDACRTAREPRRRIVAVTSVSGGSITNGVLAHGVRLGVDSTDAVDEVARELIRHTVATGSMFTAHGAWAYYFVLLPAAGLLVAGFAVAAYTWLSWAVAVRAIAALLALFALVRLFALVISRLTNPIAFGVILLLSVGATGWTLQVFLTDPVWRAGLGWLAAALVTLLVAVVAWAARGRAIWRNFEGLLKRVTKEPLLRSALPDTHHVFCATEVQTGESVYFAQDRILSRAFKWVGTGRLPTATAIGASAALPGAFPPVLLPGIDGEWSVGVRGRGKDVTGATRHMVLVDGGVRDNLGVSWLEVVQELQDVVVVSAAANRHESRTIMRLFGSSELLGLVNAINIPYNTRERHRRRAVADWLFGPAGVGGALAHIEDSPSDLARRVKEKATGARKPSLSLYLSSRPDWEIDQYLLVERLWQAGAAKQPQLVARAEAVMKHLNDLEARLPDPPSLSVQAFIAHVGATAEQPLGGDVLLGSDAEVAWWARTSLSATVPTVLNCLPAYDARNLVMHGYYLAMANLHICSGWPLGDALDGTRLSKLFSGFDLGDPRRDLATDRDLCAFREAQRRRLRARYSVVHLYSVSVQVRQQGKFAYKPVLAATGMAEDGTLEHLGLWMGPTYEDLSPEERRDLSTQLDAFERGRAAFWHDVMAGLRARGVETIRICCRELPGKILLDLMTNADAAVLAAFPGALLLPRLRSWVNAALADHASTTVGKAQLRESMLRQPGDGARIALEGMVRAWDVKLSDFRFESWDAVEPLMRLPPGLRDALDRMDAVVQQTFEALEKGSRQRGAAPDRETALALIHKDLAKAPADRKRITNWPAAYKGWLGETAVNLSPHP